VAERTFLLEVGCEEIPATMLRGALEELSSGVAAVLGSLGAAASVSKEYGGPRRLVTQIAGIVDREEDREETVLGPARSIAYGADGKPTRAAEGFAKGQGVDVRDLRIVPTPKGEAVAATRKIRGRTAAGLLSDACPRVLQSMRFPKMMRWGDRGYLFVRPVHWILSLLDEEVVPFEFMGVRSGRSTHGHRFLGRGPHEVRRAQDYEGVLRERAGVIVRIEERRRRILDLASREAAAAGGKVRPDEALVDELVFLTEHPALVRGSFPETYLSLPDPVLMTTMRHHQKYLTIEGSGGRLLNGFLAILTTDPDGEGKIRLGNEWVLKARLADAKFFFEDDRKQTLSDRIGDLGRITFHARLGTYAEKVERMGRLLPRIGEALALSREEAADAAAAVRLCKADLGTGLVGEFPELQGVVGGIYARLEGLSPGCALAIEEHYRPAGASDPVPSGGASAAVAVADKIDTLAVCFTAGFIPKGSADPYALRRSALGIHRTLIEREIRLDLTPLLDAALSQAVDAGFAKPRAAAPEGRAPKKEKAGAGADPRAALFEFMEQRLRFLLEEAGVRFDATRAVLSTGWTDPLLAWRKAKALDALRGQPDFLALAAAAKRVRNILAQAAEKGQDAAGARLDPARLSKGAEAALHEAMREARSRAESLASRDDHRGALSAIAALRGAVDRFFEDVLVMDPDEGTRMNRLALLAELKAILSSEADFAEIVVEGESAA
jgi:glycyl-tRNA synthetase beta chain